MFLPGESQGQGSLVGWGHDSCLVQGCSAEASAEHLAGAALGWVGGAGNQSAKEPGLSSLEVESSSSSQAQG